MDAGYTRIYENIFERVKELELIDTHEHLPPKEALRDSNTDVLREYLIHYFNRDLLSAGLSAQDYETAIDIGRPVVERWKILAPYWDAARHTGYGRSLDIAAKILYGVDKICGETIELLNDKFKESLKPGHYKRVLKEKSHIRLSLLDYYNCLDYDRDFFRSVYRLDKFIYPQTGTDVLAIEKESGIRICSISDWLEACETCLENAVAHGAAALKNGLAYQRTLKFERTTIKEAEEEFNNIFQAGNFIEKTEQVLHTGKHFQDYMMHFILRMVGKKGITYQFHTGLQEGSGNMISNSDPSLLANLFLEYPDVRFDIFHIGYPFQHMLAALAKNFPNVFIDMCWAHIISPGASIKALAEWIDCVPINKISAFGGDYCFVDGVCGHQYLARMNVAKALAQKVYEGLFDIGRAVRIAEMLFFENPVRIFNLTDVSGGDQNPDLR